jgi:hypothetical protein
MVDMSCSLNTSFPCRPSLDAKAFPPTITSDDVISWIQGGDAVVFFSNKGGVITDVFHNCVGAGSKRQAQAPLDSFQVIYLEGSADLELLQTWADAIRVARCKTCVCDVMRKVLTPHAFPRMRHVGLENDRDLRAFASIAPSASTHSDVSVRASTPFPRSISFDHVVEWIQQGDAVVFFNGNSGVVSDVFHSCTETAKRQKVASSLDDLQVVYFDGSADPELLRTLPEAIRGARCTACACHIRDHVLTPQKFLYMRHVGIDNPTPNYTEEGSEAESPVVCGAPPKKSPLLSST